LKHPHGLVGSIKDKKADRCFNLHKLIHSTA
jgi:hypothetical protein